MARTNRIYGIEGADLASKSCVKISYAPINAIRQPNAIIESYFTKKLAKEYGKEEKIKLIDYVSELCLYYPEKNSIETISTAISQRWLKEEKESRTWDLENYISFILEEYSNTADELMGYILGDNWECFKEKMDSRPEEVKKEWKRKIEEEMEILKNKPNISEKDIALQKIEKEIESYNEFID